MKEISDIVRASDVAQEEGKQMALATVVHVKGSSYRRPGARMLVTEDGKLTGAISGGCLEGDALRKARLVMSQQQAMLVTYDTTDDDDAKLGVGLGCNGIIQILIEPINVEDPDNPIQLLKLFLSKRQTGVLVTLFCLQNKRAKQPGTCFFLYENEKLTGSCFDKDLQPQLLADARKVMRNKASAIQEYATQAQPLTGFIEFLKPPVSLVVIGAGNDVMPLVQMAAVMGWETNVVDGRANYATVERFPLAGKVLVSKADKVLDQVRQDDQTIFLLMTHNYNYDLAMLRQLLPLQLPYIGVLGPKKKLNRMLDELQEEGMEINNEHLASVYGPVGLDVGAETSEEIALSVMAEIKAVLSKKAGTFLREKRDTIHERESKPGNQVVLS
ncbi:XdhC family protein [Pontibacter silvestris]|uniref:XdhC family protein n=1 Tax=Pontibacter silvestris TaxID=2305183 RepID=A0ABW4WU44_9BACT|nr:XdhC/CoxI family protein [Pontibacter silvestris]MCC9136950.1 XdhC family protein [Pontibacter silvestris]